MNKEKKRKTDSSKKRLNRKKSSAFSYPKIKKRLLVYICQNKFDVVRRICKQKGYSITRKFGMISDADLVWNESSAVNADILSRMKVHQKLNHFPGERPLDPRHVQHFSQEPARPQPQENVEALPQAVQLLPDDLLHAHGPHRLRKGLPAQQKCRRPLTPRKRTSSSPRPAPRERAFS